MLLGYSYKTTGSVLWLVSGWEFTSFSRCVFNRPRFPSVVSVSIDIIHGVLLYLLLAAAAPLSLLLASYLSFGLWFYIACLSLWSFCLSFWVGLEVS